MHFSEAFSSKWLADLHLGAKVYWTDHVEPLLACTDMQARAPNCVFPHPPTSARVNHPMPLGHIAAWLMTARAFEYGLSLGTGDRILDDGVPVVEQG